MQKRKKLLTGLMALVMVLSLMSLPGSVVVQAADTEWVDYFIYFDAVQGKLYKESADSFNASDSWNAVKNTEYAGDNSISCQNNTLILRNFSLKAADVAIVVEGNAVLQLEGNSSIQGTSYVTGSHHTKYGVYAFNNLIVTGGGSLTIGGRLHEAGIYTGNDLTVTDHAAISSGAEIGIQVSNNLIVDNAAVAAEVVHVHEGVAKPICTDSTVAIKVGKDITVKSGSLTGVSMAGAPTAIKAGENININGGTVEGKASHAHSSCGVSAGKDIVITGGTLIGSAGLSDVNVPNGNTLTAKAISTDGKIKITGGVIDGRITTGKRNNMWSQIYAVYTKAGIEMDGGQLKGQATTGEVAGTDPSSTYAVYTLGNILVNGGTLECDARVEYSSYSCYAEAFHADGIINVTGGILEGTTYIDSNAQGVHTYAFYAGQKILLSNTTAVGGFDKNTRYTEVQLDETNKYYADKATAQACRYIKIGPKVTGISSSASGTTPAVTVGGTTDLDAKVIPENASDQTIKWTSSDDTIASVDDSGKVTGKKPGTVIITATTKDGGYKKDFTVTVSKEDGAAAPTGITGVAPTTKGGSDGKLIGVNPTMEYSTNQDFTDAKDCTGSEVTGLPSGTYYVRVKENDTTKAGAAVAVTVPASSQKSIMDGLGVPEDTANKILSEAEKLGVSTDTLLITDASIKGQKSDDDIKGSTFNMLKARAANLKNNSVTIKWDKVKDADGYILYGNKCGKKNAYKRIKTFTKNSTVQYTQKKLKKGTYYKYLVVAYKKIDGVKVTIAASKTVHATTKGGKYGVAKSVKVNKTTKTLAVSKTFKIKASEVKQDKKIRQHRGIKYESDNKKIATVDKNGVVKAKKKGTCYIYVYAQNGVYKRIKITVK